MKLQEKGYSFTLANPRGLAPALDPLGDRTMWFGFSTDGNCHSDNKLENKVLVCFSDASLCGLYVFLKFVKAFRHSTFVFYVILISLQTT